MLLFSYMINTERYNSNKNFGVITNFFLSCQGVLRPESLSTAAIKEVDFITLLIENPTHRRWEVPQARKLPTEL